MKNSRKRLALAGLALALLVGGCSRSPDPAEHAGINADPADWPGFGRTPGSQDYSPLDKLNTGNVGQLSLVWSYDLPPGNSLTAPVESGGVLYTATGYSVVTAFDAVTGRVLWRYDPKAAEAAGRKLRFAWGSRGLAYENGRVFVGTVDGRLIALDAKTGGVDWSVLTTQPGDFRYVTGPPRVFNGKVLIGHGGGDLGATRGYVTCYDAATGRRLWRFYTTPGDPALGFEDPALAIASRTWAPGAWKLGGGGAVWHAITYDPEFDRFYIGAGNPLPEDRDGDGKGKDDGLFAASIVAINAETGKYVWHYQVNPGDKWDFDASMDIELATLTIDGTPRKVLMQAPKNGFFYVIDRTNGKLISAQPFAKTTWASRIDLTTGRPVEAPALRGAGPFELWPGPTGAHNWLPMAFSPKTNLVYLPVTDVPAVITGGATNYTPNLPDAFASYLEAWDPVSQKSVWRVATSGSSAGGAIATGGNLVFQGQINHVFNAYDARTGRTLWSFDARAPVVAPPITYEVNGVQYVTVLTGFSGTTSMTLGTNNPAFAIDFWTMPRRVLTFAIGGKATLPPAPAPQRVATPDPTFVADAAHAAKGMMTFTMNCSVCHGFNAIAAGAAPDLRWSPVPKSKDAFHRIVRGGALVSQGMPRYDDLSPEAVEDIRFYLRSRAYDLQHPGAAMPQMAFSMSDK